MSSTRSSDLERSTVKSSGKTATTNTQTAGYQGIIDLADDHGTAESCPTNSQLKHSFNIWSSLGLQYSLTSTPLLIGTYLSLVIGVGGSPTFIYGYIVAVVLNLCVCATLAEIAAIYPHTSGTMYWTAVMAPEKHARILSYAVAWLLCGALLLLTGGTYLITSQLICAMITICSTEFIPQPWHVYTLYILAALLALIFNLPPLFTLYPTMLKAMPISITTGALFILTVLLIRTSAKQSSQFVWLTFTNTTNWPSHVVVFFLGLLPGATAVNGFDGASHLSSELPDPKHTVPRVMLGSAVLSALSGLPMCIVYMYCVTDASALLSPIGGQPLAQLFLDSLHSLPLTIISLLIVIVCLVACGVCMLTAFARVAWKLAQRNGLPASGWVAAVSPGCGLPVHAVLFCSGLCVAVGAIVLGSTTAINAVIGGGMALLYLTWLPLLMLVLCKRGTMFPARRSFNLGRAGRLVNVVSVVWIPFVVVWMCFPLYLPVTAASMNYAAVVIVGTLFISGLNWVGYSSGRYEVPVAMELK
ncbi:amino acid transporter [Saccharata proteae CBS 121410]|uniref:Amino acid transporter n=1 Tax=Saccharata proteae CBS 121410 TaxID=1314787 RepID=A0A9P4LZS5_9PEZI|nr:amino acid transporter [Saccharata proteae CBS 121410]